jgi:hypothetical protein
MVEKLKEVSSVPTTNDYAVLVTVKVLPQISELLVYLKEENTNAVLYKIEGAQDENFVYAEELMAETSLVKNGGTSKTLTGSWLYMRVLHKAAVAGVQGKTSCIISGSGGLEISADLVALLYAAGGGPYALSDDILVADDAEVSGDHDGYTKIKEIDLGYLSGTIRISFDLKCASGHWVHGCIYKNGVALSDEHNINDTSYFTYTDELALAKGDLVQLYIFNSDAGFPASVRNFRVKGKFPIPQVPAVNTV